MSHSRPGMEARGRQSPHPTLRSESESDPPESPSHPTVSYRVTPSCQECSLILGRRWGAEIRAEVLVPLEEKRKGIEKRAVKKS